MSYTFFEERPAKLKDAKVYETENSGFLHLSLVYEYTTDDGIYELHLPKIQLPFSTSHTPLIKNSREKMYKNTVEAYEYDFVLHDVTGYKMTSYTGDEFKNEQPASSFIVKIHSFEKPAKEMTIEEIEAVLGHKVKIIGEKE